MIAKPNCAECPISNCPQVPGLGTRTEGTKLLKYDAKQFDLVCVGMYPGQDEIRSRMPLTGASGQFARKTLKQLDVETYYVTNVLLCPVPLWAKEEQIARAVECCSERLSSEVAELKPKLILAMGDLPFHQLCENNLSITEHAGRLFMSKLGVPLVPVPNAAYYLRRYEDAYDFIESTRAGIRYLQNNYHQVGEVSYVLVTKQNVDSVVEELEKHDVLAVDAETSGFYAQGVNPDHILEIGISYDEKTCYIVPVTDSRAYPTEGAASLHPDASLLLRFKALLETKRIKTWNGFFDARFIKVFGTTINHWFDGMLAHYCLDERSGSHGLKKVARTYLGAGDWEADIKKYLKNPKNDSYANIPPEVRWEYLAKDVCYTFELCDLLHQEIGDNWPFWNVLMPATRVFTETTFNGLLINPDKVVEVLAALQENLKKDEEILWKLANKPFNPRSATQCIPIIFDQFGVPAHPKFGRSTNKKVMEEYRESYPIVDKIISYRESAHDISNYIEGFVYRIDKEFKVHPSIKLFGTVTGRISSSDPSIMNIKNKSRVCEIVSALPGRYIAVFDAKGMELRCYYLYSADEVLKDILVNGYQGDLGFPLTNKQRKDPHYMIGAIAFGQERADELRIVAKTIVFGRMYLRGLKSIEDTYGRATALKLVDTMAQIIPKQPKYVKARKEEVRTKGYVESYFHRLRRFPIITNENRAEVERMCCNMPIQSAGSDLNMLNFIHLWSIKDRWDIMPMFTIHDSIVVDIPSPKVVPEIQAELERHAFEIVEGKMPFPYDSKFGKSWVLDSEE